MIVDPRLTNQPNSARAVRTTEGNILHGRDMTIRANDKLGYIEAHTCIFFLAQLFDVLECTLLLHWFVLVAGADAFSAIIVRLRIWL